MAQRKVNKSLFAYDLTVLRSEVSHTLSIEDYRHLRRYERLGKLCSFLGYATGWLFPNPIAAYLLALGNFTRWMTAHNVLHGAYNDIPGIPAHYHSNRFARGWRRYIDWFDWITPEAWKYEHNSLHHTTTGQKSDPDQVERLFRFVRNAQVPLFAKHFLFWYVAFTWKWSYYAPSTTMHLQKNLKMDSSKNFNFYRLLNPFTRNGRMLWTKSYLPYASFKFVFIPACFLPLGTRAAISMLLTNLMAEAFANFHSYLNIGPNHTAADLYRFDDRPHSSMERKEHQIFGTTNFSGTSWLMDFLHGGMNYHIEHHLWPHLTQKQCKDMSPRLRALCTKHRYRYVMEPVSKRFQKLIKVCVGKNSMRVWPHESPVEREVLKSA